MSTDTQERVYCYCKKQQTNSKTKRTNLSFWYS